MTHHSGRRIISTAIVATALAGALATGGGSAAADSLDPIENVVGAGSAATLVIADEIGSSEALTTVSNEILGPVLDVGSTELGSVCAAARNLLLGQNYCIAPFSMGGQG
ncbi:hypothetical protein BTZ20_4615 [Rhodococcus sp. MTM3W5.2]|uniref:hypothetical protein n=1 Tax=Rhodococcus sp. MTM3W5.2 TaxID=1805827 RepID=UPI0009796CBB|nr:hypothetical protein [Rhodococcus sp. MTM3W5.2]AQA22777.1 hypothetical protein BTZ20_4615 [Rhodococcus sp. MTM3W5.2]